LQEKQTKNTALHTLTVKRINRKVLIKEEEKKKSVEQK
jgi:hypothetical protein